MVKLTFVKITLLKFSRLVKSWVLFCQIPKLLFILLWKLREKEISWARWYEEGKRNLGQAYWDMYVSSQDEVSNWRTFPVFSEEISRSGHVCLYETTEHRIQQVFSKNSLRKQAFGWWRCLWPGGWPVLSADWGFGLREVLISCGILGKSQLSGPLNSPGCRGEMS